MTNGTSSGVAGRIDAGECGGNARPTSTVLKLIIKVLIIRDQLFELRMMIRNQSGNEADGKQW